MKVVAHSDISLENYYLSAGFLSPVEHFIVFSVFKACNFSVLIHSNCSHQSRFQTLLAAAIEESLVNQLYTTKPTPKNRKTAATSNEIEKVSEYFAYISQLAGKQQMRFLLCIVLMCTVNKPHNNY